VNELKMTAKMPPVVERMLARHAILADEQKDEFLDLFLSDLRR
jgi:hypothetical protein